MTDTQYILEAKMKIIVLNLNRNTKVAQLERLFAKHGNVESCNLVTDKQTGESKGFGFVEMPNEDEANDAISKLHAIKLDNHKIRVKISDSSKD